jgi:hypothetical protein
VKNVIHAFSVEMKSKHHVKNISISDEAHDRVLFEGNLGELLELSLEGNVLELVGVNGVLRVGLTKKQLMKARIINRETSLSSEVGSYRNTKKKGEVKKGNEM